MRQKNSLVIFFDCLLIGFLISSLRSDVVGVPPTEVVTNLFYAFAYNLIIGIWTGIAGLFGSEIYFFIKKNLKNERCWNILRLY